jgi:Tol biopolymer transport system component
MPEVREVFEAVTAPPEPGARERQHRRQRRAVRTHQLGALVVTAAIVIGIVLVALFSGHDGASRLGDDPTVPAPATSEDDTYLLAIGDGALTPLPAPLDGSSYRFALDGSAVAFAAVDADGQQLIYRMDPDGTGVTTLTDRAFLGEWAVGPDEPSWSPDGKWLVVSGTDVNSGRRDLYFVSSNGYAPPRSGIGWGSISQPSEPAWSPNDRAIAFTSMGNDGPEIRVVRPDRYGGGSITTIGHPKTLLERASSPSWSQDGTRIAFVATDTQLVSIANADGTNVRAITDGPSANPAWSPDGASIAYDDLSSGRIAIYDVATQQISYLDAAACTQGWADAATLLVSTECDA